MSKEYIEALENLKTALHNEWLRFYPQFKELDEKTKFVDGVRMVSSDADAFINVKQALQRLEAIDNANPSEALETLKDMLIGNGVNDNINDYVDNLILPIKQALIQAEKDRKKLNEIEKLTRLLYSERRKIGQEYVKWCKENNTLFNDETNMITWVLAIKLKEWLK